jgi:tetratricopeptide (TPR) repeat protein
MKLVLLLLLLVLSPYQVLAQSENPVGRKDSVSVSAGISKEQLALEDQLNQLLSNGDGLLKSGNTSEAIAQYRKALELVQKQSLLTEQEARVEKKLAVGYMLANQPTDAIPIYEKLLSSQTSACNAASEKPSECADAQFELARAKMYARDFVGALALLKEAESNYVRAEKMEGKYHEFEMIQVKNQGQTNVLLAVALFRTGNSTEATKTLEFAISQLKRVQSDESILVGIRDDAARSLEEAQTILSKLQSNQ